ncbi:hypothetical protein [Piscinibacter sakaiensis]|uniref:hypothetical protein n=1 Tax=Piscinibacter sakaiensis TaxID=1547922 RepID=UPI003AABF51B
MNPVIAFESVADAAYPIARELVCTIWQLDGASERSESEVPVVDRQPVLVGSALASPGDAEIALPASGNYLVDVVLPNGRRSRRTLSLADGERYRYVLRESRYGQASPSVAPTTLLTRTKRVVASAFRAFSGHAELEVSLVTTDASREHGGLGSLRTFFEVLEGDSDRARVIERESSLGLSYAFELDAAINPDDADPHNPLYRRSWLVVSGSGRDATVVPFPNGWRSAAGSQSCFLVTARRKATTGDESTKWSVSLQLRDASHGSLLGYLTRRDIQASNAVSGSSRSQAMSALYDKQVNPFAASAGAYLLAMSEEDLDHEQKGWLENLTQRFPWLPDGAIAQGYQLMRQSEKGTEKFDLARELLVRTSVERGLPFFSVGLSLLTEGLNFLALVYRDDPTIQQSLASAIAAQTACARDEVFSTLQTSRFKRLPEGPGGLT